MAVAILTRTEIETREDQTLAPYAARAAQSRGRVYAQPEHPLRTAFQRDRDRTVHAAAFRRMEYKTQVFIPHEQDHFRTRLTHTIEVAQISRTLTRNLRLNEDLAEAVALVHDLGHTPFGHSGEGVLDRLLAEHGGFNHNRQSLRVVDILEQRYADHPGLNLSYEVREGIAKHETSVKIDRPEFADHPQPTLEASLVDIADEIAYNAHDIDDGLSSGIITNADIEPTDWYQALTNDGTSGPLSRAPEYRRYELVRHMVNRIVTDVLQETARVIQASGVASLDDVRGSDQKLVGYSKAMAEIVADLKNFLRTHLYRHDRLQKMSVRADRIIEAIYQALLADTSSMPRRFQMMLVDQPPEIVIADYIAGMTDRYAEKIYTQLPQ
jgi:dGTPase